MWGVWGGPCLVGVGCALACTSHPRTWRHKVTRLASFGERWSSRVHLPRPRVRPTEGPHGVSVSVWRGERRRDQHPFVKRATACAARCYTLLHVLDACHSHIRPVCFALQVIPCVAGPALVVVCVASLRFGLAQAAHTVLPSDALERRARPEYWLIKYVLPYRPCHAARSTRVSRRSRQFRLLRRSTLGVPAWG